MITLKGSKFCQGSVIAGLFAWFYFALLMNQYGVMSRSQAPAPNEVVTQTAVGHLALNRKDVDEQKTSHLLLNITHALNHVA